MKRPHGFTVIELIVVIVFVTFASILLIYQRANIEASRRDEIRKSAINAMYYNLEEVFYDKNQFYPETINPEVLRAMDSELFTDPSGNELGEPDSDYRYTAVDCENEKCKGYTLSSRLEKEADFTKTNRR